jgi:polyhydroxyalkanoate synthase subunit PhaC
VPTMTLTRARSPRSLEGVSIGDRSGVIDPPRPALGRRALRLGLTSAVRALDVLGRLARRPFALAPLATERHVVETRDGWRLGLRRLRTSERPARGPLLFVHGLGGTGNAFLMPGRSPAQHLAQAGFDCWVVDLRGRPGSQPPAGSLCRDWDMDDYLDLDIPPVIETVLRESGRPRLGWVGHSMGGILAYTYVIRCAPESVAGVVSLGAALDYTHGESGFRELARLRPLLDLLPYVPVGALGQLGALLLGLLPASVERFSFHPRNLERALARRYFANTMCNVSCAELRNLCSVVELGGLCDRKRERWYAREAERFSAPLLAVAGDDDHQCNLVDARATFDLVGSADKSFVGVGSAFGHAAPYGHEDLLVGRHTLSEVWPQVAEWLAGRLRA